MIDPQNAPEPADDRHPAIKGYHILASGNMAVVEPNGEVSQIIEVIDPNEYGDYS